jgi:glycosyltransferase involved in cell wall biosynthesis
VIPNKLFQIMAIGRPVVTADTAGIREILEPGPGIRLTAAGDPEDVAKKIVDLVDCLTDANRRGAEVQGAMALPSIGNEQLGLQLSGIFSDCLPSAAATRGNKRNDR